MTVRPKSLSILSAERSTWWCTDCKKRVEHDHDCPRAPRQMTAAEQIRADRDW